MIITFSYSDWVFKLTPLATRELKTNYLNTEQELNWLLSYGLVPSEDDFGMNTKLICIDEEKYIKLLLKL